MPACGSKILILALLLFALLIQVCDNKNSDGKKSEGGSTQNVTTASSSETKRYKHGSQRKRTDSPSSMIANKNRKNFTKSHKKTPNTKKPTHMFRTTHFLSVISPRKNRDHVTSSPRKQPNTRKPPLMSRTTNFPRAISRSKKVGNSTKSKEMGTLSNKTSQMFSTTDAPSATLLRTNLGHSSRASGMAPSKVLSTTNTAPTTLPAANRDHSNRSQEKGSKTIKPSKQLSTSYLLPATVSSYSNSDQLQFKITPEKFSSTISPSAQLVCGNFIVGSEKTILQETRKDNSTDSVDVRNRTQVQKVVKTALDLLSKDTGTNQINQYMESIKLLEDIGKMMALQMKPTKGKPATVSTVVGEQVFGVVAMDGSRLSGFSFPNQIEGLEEDSSAGARIDLPNSVLNSSEGDTVILVFMIYNPSSAMNARTGDNPGNVTLTGKVTLVSVFPQPTLPFTKPVVITIKNTIMYSNTTVNPICVYLMENLSRSEKFGIWSTNGCQLVHSNASHFTCHCYHLTNFAVLLQFDENEPPEDDEKALSIITYVGLSLSVIGCLLTFIAHLLVPKLWNDRGFIHMNMVASLGIANTVFMFGTLPEVNSTSCTVVAMILFYFYLAVFSWMLLEGVQIYRMLVKVFGTDKDPRKLYVLAGWGIPLVIVTVSILVYHEDVTSRYYCWLSATSGAIWMFGVPVSLVIFLNVMMLMVVLKTSLHHAKKDKHLQRSAAKTSCSVVPVLGITWVFGIITFNMNFLALQYIFAILNSLQGFAIFVLYCLCNVEVKREISQKISQWKTEQDIGKEQNNKSSNPKYFNNYVTNVKQNIKKTKH